MKKIGNMRARTNGIKLTFFDIVFRLYSFIYINIKADVMKIAENMPKTYLIDPTTGDLSRCPNSRIPKNKNVINR